MTAKRRICLVPDIPGWAWHRRAEGIRLNAPPEFHVDTITWNDWRPELQGEYDATLHFSWTDAKRFRNCWALVANEGCQYEYNPNSPVYQQRTASKNKNASVARDYLKRFRGVICINRGCLDFVKECNPRTVYLRTGVDTDVFTPSPTATHRKSPQLTVGWCGKPSTDSKFSPKGYEEVLLPVMRSFAGLDGVDFWINSRDSSCAMSTAEMLNWYRSLDVLLVTSCSEGTPSVLMEAMACGVPFISTAVGIVPEIREASRPFLNYSGSCGIVIPKWTDLSTASTTAASAIDVIRWCIGHRQELAEMGQNARRVIEHSFSWRELSATWCETLTAARQ